MCGMSFIQQPQQPEQTASQLAAQSELKKRQSEGILVPAMSFTIGGMMLLIGIFAPASLLIGLPLIGFGIYSLVQRHKRISDLKKISDGAQLISVCPKCKSPNIQMAVVQSSSITLQGKTTVGENINPLRPFTHVNVNHGPTSTVNNFSNQCHCLTCGNVFSKPETIIK